MRSVRALVFAAFAKMTLAWSRWMPFPYWSVEHEYLPTPARVAEAAEKVLAY